MGTVEVVVSGVKLMEVIGIRVVVRKRGGE